MDQMDRVQRLFERKVISLAYAVVDALMGKAGVVAALKHGTDNVQGERLAYFGLRDLSEFFGALTNSVMYPNEKGEMVYLGAKMQSPTAFYALQKINNEKLRIEYDDLVCFGLSHEQILEPDWSELYSDEGIRLMKLFELADQDFSWTIGLFGEHHGFVSEHNAHRTILNSLPIFESYCDWAQANNATVFASVETHELLDNDGRSGTTFVGDIELETLQGVPDYNLDAKFCDDFHFDTQEQDTVVNVFWHLLSLQLRQIRLPLAPMVEALNNAQTSAERVILPRFLPHFAAWPEPMKVIQAQWHAAHAKQKARNQNASELFASSNGLNENDSFDALMDMLDPEK